VQKVSTPCGSGSTTLVPLPVPVFPNQQITQQKIKTLMGYFFFFSQKMCRYCIVLSLCIYVPIIPAPVSSTGIELDIQQRKYDLLPRYQYYKMVDHVVGYLVSLIFAASIFPDTEVFV
jgi:hypothetical protein